MVEILDTVFMVCAIVGFCIPLLNIISCWISGGGDIDSDFDLDTDVDMDFDLDADVDLDFDLDADLDLDADFDLDAGLSAEGIGFEYTGLRFNLMCFCLMLIVFGVIGKALIGLMDSVLAAVLLSLVALASGMLFYWLLYRFLVSRLKASNPVAMSFERLVGRVGEVTLRITEDSMGTISVKDSTGAFISFRAKIDPVLIDRSGGYIAAGEKVSVTGLDIEEKFCYVSTLQNKSQEKEIK